MKKVSNAISVKINYGPDFQDIIITETKRDYMRSLRITHEDFKKIVELFNEGNS